MFNAVFLFTCPCFVHMPMFCSGLYIGSHIFLMSDMQQELLLLARSGDGRLAAELSRRGKEMGELAKHHRIMSNDAVGIIICVLSLSVN